MINPQLLWRPTWYVGTSESSNSNPEGKREGRDVGVSDGISKIERGSTSKQERVYEKACSPHSQ